MNNTAIGFSSGYGNTTGYNNALYGYKSGYSNGTGFANTFIGNYTGYSNSAAYETFVGYLAGYSNKDGFDNTFLGVNAGVSNTTGAYNTFTGLDAGYTNVSGSRNSATGLQALGQSTSDCNTALGYQAGYTIKTGKENTFVGCSADASGDYSNSGAFGSGASTTADDMIIIGNSAVNYIGGYSDWHNISDGRFKNNVTENVKGLDFIKRLRPVTYNLNASGLNSFINQNRAHSVDSSGNPISSCLLDFNASSSIVHSGFIAQEVETAEQASGFTSSIVHVPVNASDPYSLSYAEFVVPLVKAVQQLDSVNQTLQSQLRALQDQIIGCCGTTQRHALAPQDSSLNQSQSQSIALDVTLSSKSIVLEQNQPNPFKEQTTINYFIPDDAKNVKIIFTDLRGNIMKEVSIPEKGNGQINVYAQDLSSGIYTYTLVSDGVTIDSKKMVCSK